MTFRVNADEDGYTIGFHRLRDCTTREAKHILIGIFGFVMPQYDEMFGHDHAILRFNTEVIKDVHAFLDGDVAYHLRPGLHYFARDDWHQLIKFINQHR